jgi:hypothetical protein
LNKDSNNLALNRSNTPDGTSPNETFVAGETCPAAVHGDHTLTDRHSTPNTFLTNATEVLNDSIGDEDGLCESNEHCIYAPNYGAYQGHGDWRSNGTWVFEDGTGGSAVTGVTMYAYPENGV